MAIIGYGSLLFALSVFIMAFLDKSLKPDQASMRYTSVQCLVIYRLSYTVLCENIHTTAIILKYEV